LPVSVMTPIAVGLIGGFTTFSTFTWEAFTMSRTGRPAPALIYIAVSFAAGSCPRGPGIRSVERCISRARAGIVQRCRQQSSTADC
jgi:fluoride ion exporter CrcB/FEX